MNEDVKKGDRAGWYANDLGLTVYKGTVMEDYDGTGYIKIRWDGNDHVSTCVFHAYSYSHNREGWS